MRDGIVKSMSQTNDARSCALTPAERLINLVRNIITQPGVARPIPIDAQLSDLGMSSLKMVNLMLAVEVEFDISISPNDITPDNFRSIGSVERLVSRLIRTTGA
jgi:acyl carrier protein